MLRELLSDINGWLPGSLTLFFASLVAWRMLRKRLTNSAKKPGSTPSTPKSDSWHFGPRGSTHYAPIWFSLFCTGALLYGVLRIPHFPVYEYYNVSVLQKVAPNKWAMSKDDGPFLYEGCPDFPNERVIWAGYVARKVRYEEQGNCKSILRPDLGFWWDRDSQYNVKEIH